MRREKDEGEQGHAAAVPTAPRFLTNIGWGLEESCVYSKEHFVVACVVVVES